MHEPHCCNIAKWLSMTRGSTKTLGLYIVSASVLRGQWETRHSVIRYEAQSCNPIFIVQLRRNGIGAYQCRSTMCTVVVNTSVAGPASLLKFSLRLKICHGSYTYEGGSDTSPQIVFASLPELLADEDLRSWRCPIYKANIYYLSD